MIGEEQRNDSIQRSLPRKLQVFGPRPGPVTSDP